MSRYISFENESKIKEEIYSEIIKIKSEIKKEECNHSLKNIIENYSDKYIFEFYSSKIIQFIYFKKEKVVIYFNGNGEMVYKGEFNIKKKQFEGFGILYSEDEIYEGYFLNNKKNGKGILKLKNELELYGIWENGQLKEINKELYLKI